MDDIRTAGFDALLRLAIGTRRHTEAIAAGFGLTSPLARMLLLLDEPMRMHAIADVAGCEPSHVTGLAAQLEQAGLARRRVDPADRRARQLELTAKGRRLRATLLPALLEGAPVLSTLDDDQVERLLELIEVSGAVD